MSLFGWGAPKASGPVEFIIAGLGNPGEKYAMTRHNAGFRALDKIAKKYGARLTKIRFKSVYDLCTIEGKRVLLLKPQTFMNLSGEAVRDAMQFYKVPAEKTLILFDDISLPCGGLRVRRKGSDGGQNGMKNIIYLTGSDAFPRVKIGIGAKPHPDYDLADWVLSRFGKEENVRVEEALEKAVGAAEKIVAGKIDEAMNLYNQK